MNVRLRDMPHFLREHRWARMRVSDYIDGEVSGAHAQRVEEHVSRCPRCRRLLAALERTVAALRQLDRPPLVGGDVAERVIVRLRAER